MLIGTTFILLYTICSTGDHECLVNSLIAAEMSRDSGIIALEVQINNSYKGDMLPVSRDNFILRFKWKHKTHFVLEVKDKRHGEYKRLLACDGNHVWTNDGALWEYPFFTHRYRNYDELQINKFSDKMIILDYIIVPHITPLGGFINNPYLKDYYKTMKLEENSVVTNGARKWVLTHPDASYLRHSFIGTNTPCAVGMLILTAKGYEGKLMFGSGTSQLLPATIGSGSLIIDNEVLSWKSTLREIGLPESSINPDMLHIFKTNGVHIVSEDDLGNIHKSLSQMNLLELHGQSPVIRFDWSKVYELSMLQGWDLAFRHCIVRLFDKESCPGYVWAEETEKMIYHLYNNGLHVLVVHIIIVTVSLQAFAILLYLLKFRR